MACQSLDPAGQAYPVEISAGLLERQRRLMERLG
jgi:hypothetical protein